MKSTIKNLLVAFIAAIIMLSLNFKTLGQNNTSWNIYNNIGIGGSKYLEFGRGTGKQSDAGKIGYQTFTPGSLDIVGAGTLSTNRKIKFWNEGSAMFTGSIGVGLANPIALLHVYQALGPNIRVTSNTTELEFAVAGCNGCYSVNAVTGDLVMRTLPGGGINNQKMIFSLGGWGGNGRAFRFETHVGTIVSIDDNNFVSIGGNTVSNLAPTGGYRLGVSGNTNINGSLVLGDPATITSLTRFPAGFKLYVTEGILAEKVQVALKTTADWSDFVFAPDYNLMPLDSVECFIQENKHLPDVPSAEEVVSTGIDLGKMDAKLLQKIEELTLYMIEMKKENQEMKREIESLKQAQGN